MAQVVLSAVGQSVGGGIGRIVGATLGRAIDNRVVASLGPARQIGPRLETLKVQGTAEGAPMVCVFGRARVTGQVIWAARFLEGKTKGRAGKGGPKTVDYTYSLSFAVALCEGEIDGVGRVWADGRAMDMSGVTMRVHRGDEDQTPDPLIEAVEGAAPAYRGTAYVVFEDLPLGPFGDRVPQLSFEVFRRPRGQAARLEDLLEGVCLIPGAGEFALATEAVLRRDGLTRTTAENVHNGEGRADLLVSLDQLQAQLPNLKRVSLVVGWFGGDLRAGECRVRPGVERRDKPTEPFAWSVAGVARDDAYVVSQVDGAPAYGGTPADDSVRQAIRELKARGLAVTLYPFVFMDCPGYPWRGRVAGVDGAGATAEIAALFGTADGWGLRRMALHYARIAADEGADGMLIGSEMRGVTWTRDADGGFPAVDQFRALAAECRAVVGPAVTLSYAADWSEYFGWQAGGEVVFHLDPLWADPNIDHVSIDWYPPLSDWREGDLIAAVLARGGLSPDEMSVEGVEGAAAGYVIDRPMRTRDALEPLLAAFDVVAAERDGRVAVRGRVAVEDELALAALALPERGASAAAVRTLEDRPTVARVRFIDETADYQTGAVVVRSDDARAQGGGVDLDLPVVCGGGLARAAALDVLAGSGMEAATVALGPLEALKLEPADVVRLEGRSGDWRVMRLTADETPSAVLEPVISRGRHEDAGAWRGGEAPAVVGAPFVKILDLPPLIGAEEDARPVIAAAADPWRTMRLHAGPQAQTLTPRGDVETPATVGVLIQPLGPGVRHRWDAVNALVMRVEGRAPESAIETAVLGGANAVAVETGEGWEVIQYRAATLVAPGTWRLSGLLRGQQGTEEEMRAGAPVGAKAVFLDERLARAEIGRGERGLPLICRAGPAGAPPGGTGFTEVGFTLAGRHARPWSPCGLLVSGGAAGWTIRWTPRVRLYGDGWDGEPAPVDPLRFRVRVLIGDAVVRTDEVEGVEQIYPAETVATDFARGASAPVRIAVAQWGEGFGWGVEAVTAVEIGTEIGAV
ncbi:MAG: glycoside hydrolase TIM-barrel-like domain-containing protein [Brevundimonas sp.]|uniref:baseplate megatron protein TIM-barrel domain-containing protein n=1 Tax=Brevundimonas sp. TaxID=1871086 RepID=UPI0028D86214|nr:glycoside hydrolase TIM-barrel-like domain-containing protein [uncultured Brevundimonas sp.]